MGSLTVMVVVAVVVVVVVMLVVECGIPFGAIRCLLSARVCTCVWLWKAVKDL